MDKQTSRLRLSPAFLRKNLIATGHQRILATRKKQSNYMWSRMFCFRMVILLKQSYNVQDYTQVLTSED